MSLQFDTRSNRTSLLDDNFDISYIDIIRDFVLKYIKQEKPSHYIKLMDGFYGFKLGRLYKINYDNNPANWYIVYKPLRGEYYISTWPRYSIRTENRLIMMMRTNECCEPPRIEPVTLEYILEQNH